VLPLADAHEERTVERLLVLDYQLRPRQDLLLGQIGQQRGVAVRYAR
jgi:hypothetical protein